MNKYVILKERQRKEINEFPIFFAFDNKQFDEGMQKFGLMPDDKASICNIGGGGFILKSDVHKFQALFDNHDADLKAEIENDKTGERFIFDMFFYELCNYEYMYSHELDGALDEIGLSKGDIVSSPKLMVGLKRAIAAVNKLDL